MKPTPAIFETTVRRVESGKDESEFADVLAVEEPLEIRLGFADGTHKAISITMRTPGDDAELAAGFLFTEGIIDSFEQIKQIRHCGLKIGTGKGALERASTLNSNTIRVDLADGVEVDLERLQRHFYTSSSCGVCGKSSIEALSTGTQKIAAAECPKIDSAFIHEMPNVLRSAQTTFDKTGGLHASALFDAEGNLDIVREDVGRHNALDKVIGAKFLSDDLPLDESVLLVSGRASFELVQKALMAGIPILAAVGAPSSLAVELAREFGMTLIGFVRDDRFNIYCGNQRIVNCKLADR
ncbi:MAG: formate dehydrogenase accessory sulfurtransferase FdhD [Acidobacteria bacterium]|nr:formate dehydrogenase accessory sulfurtransferase FdhD [Acidobacteriota bacterium]